MENNGFDWVEEREAVIKEERAAGYFDIIEGKQQFILLSHCAPFPQVFDPATKKYRAATEGDTGVSIKGVCWVLQDGVIKQAKLPYTIVKSIRALQQDPEWDFVIPFPHTLTLGAEGAGTKEVKYSLTPSPKQVTIPAEILAELKKKPTLEEIVEKIKGSKSTPTAEEPGEDIYPDGDPAEITAF